MALVERDAALLTFDRLLKPARTGTGHVLLASGEAGIGKTTLLKALATRRGEAALWWGACDCLETPHPLAPLHDIAHNASSPAASPCAWTAPSARRCRRDEAPPPARAQQGPAGARSAQATSTCPLPKAGHARGRGPCVSRLARGRAVHWASMLPPRQGPKHGRDCSLFKLRVYPPIPNWSPQ